MFRIKQIQYFCSCWSKNIYLNLFVFDIFIFGIGEMLAYGTMWRIAFRMWVWRTFASHAGRGLQSSLASGWWTVEDSKVCLNVNITLVDYRTLDLSSILDTMLTSCCGCLRRVRPRSRTTSAERSSSSLTRASCLRATATTAAPRGWAPDTRWATTATPRPSTTMTSSKLASRNCCRQRSAGGGESRDAVKYVNCILYYL